MAREREPGKLVNLSASGATVTGAHSPAPLVTLTRAATAQPRSPPPVTPSPQASQASPLLSEPLDWGTDAKEEDDDDAIAPELHNGQRRHSIRRPPKHAKQLLHLRRPRLSIRKSMLEARKRSSTLLQREERDCHTVKFSS
uniref:Uncharacterized protein n=1 Tax=Oryza glaberrima TaxID=4538 RepID=I1QV74_ORYGL